MLLQHCRPAVDEDTFTRLVERQMEILRRGGNPLTSTAAPSSAQPAVPPAAPAENQPQTNGTTEEVIVYNLQIVYI